jgi:diacylglycerol kinase (ATP)
LFGLLKKAPARFAKSFGYSWDGLKATFAKEESFRLETLSFIILLAAMLVCRWPWWKQLILATTFLLIPLLEIVNSAIEDICDLITREPSALIKNAKDKGALAVLIAIVINALTLALLLAA